MRNINPMYNFWFIVIARSGSISQGMGSGCLLLFFCCFCEQSFQIYLASPNLIIWSSFLTICAVNMYMDFSGLF